MDSENKKLKEILADCGFRFSKSLGQNFLTDKKILNKIIDDARLANGETVLEIGPGAGTLTRLMAQRGACVLSVEIDRSLKPVLERTLTGLDSVSVIYEDFMKLDLDALYKSRLTPGFKVIANIPYYITTPIVMRLLESGLPYKSITVLVQREVALRMAASPGSPQYGALSCAVQYYTSPALQSRINPGCFYPPPKVESQVITLCRLDKPPVEVIDKAVLFKVIKCAFAMRRKTFANNLISAFSYSRGQAEELLNALKLPANIRGEALSLKDMAHIADYICTQSQGG